MKKSKRRAWSYSAGSRGTTVRVFEREKPGDVIYAGVWDPAERRYRTWSLRHRDRNEAKAYAHAQAARLQTNRDDVLRGTTTLDRLFTLYLRFQSPKKSVAHRYQDARQAELWIRTLGRAQDIEKITRRQVDDVISLRMSGDITARGLPVVGPARRVGPRTAALDIEFLRTAINWGLRWKDDAGRYLLREDPLRGYSSPREENPARPVASDDDLVRLLAVADEVHPSLAPMLLIASETGRRIGAICALQFGDLDLSTSETAPFGRIRWRAEADKQGYETVAPISPRVRSVIDSIVAERPGLGRAPLFPAPKDPARPVRRDVAGAWMAEAKARAGIAGRRFGWHALRRRWATVRKHLPLADVAKAGGWRSLDALQRSYIHADEATTLRVVLSGGELRIARNPKV